MASIFLHGDRTPDDAFFGDAVDDQITFCPDGIGARCIKWDVFNEFPFKGGLRIFFPLHIIFQKMHLLDVAVESFKAIQLQRKSKRFTGRADDASYVLALRLDYFQGGLRIKRDIPMITEPKKFLAADTGA